MYIQYVFCEEIRTDHDRKSKMLMIWRLMWMSILTDVQSKKHISYSLLSLGGWVLQDCDSHAPYG